MQFANHEVQSRAAVALTLNSAETALETAFSPKLLIFYDFIQITLSNINILKRKLLPFD